MINRNESAIETGDRVRLPDGSEGTVVDIEQEDEATVLVNGEEEMVCVAQIVKIS